MSRPADAQQTPNVVSFPDAGSRPKLLDRVRHAIRTRHYSSRTEEAYVHWIRRYIVFHEKKHPSTLGAPDISRFLTWLAVERQVSASTQNQALSAVLFLYKVLAIEVGAVPTVVRARTPERLPVVLSRDEIGAILKQLTGTERLVVMLLYGSGVRLEECLELRVKDLDFDRHQIIVRQGKGQKDRMTMLPAAARETLTRHLADVRRLHQADLARGFGRVVLPFALDRKFPNAPTEWRWQFVFPAGRICRDPRYGSPSRYHLHKSVIQKAVAHAARLAGTTKRLSPHVMRSVSAWYPPFRDGSFQRQFVLSTDRAREFAAVVDGLDASLHQGPLQIDALDYPRGTCDDLRGGQHTVGDEVFDDCIADAELARGGLQRQPGAIVVVVGESPTVSHVRDVMHAPRLARTSPVPQTIEDDGDRFVVADF
jgi:integron integrase